MEERKVKEIEFYDSHAKEAMENLLSAGRLSDFEGFRPLDLGSFRFVYSWLEANCLNKKLLDYGCGHGLHSLFASRKGAEVVGIDLSEPSLNIARTLAEKEGLNIEFLKMDAENLSFENSSFDIVFDGGTFSSIDLDKATPGILRVLKPRGTLIGIETFGHNPFTNLKRMINRLAGKRTGWATDHIFNSKRLERLSSCFGSVTVRYFHIFSWILIPFLKYPFVKKIMPSFEKIDAFLEKNSVFKKLAFKVVFILSDSKND